MHKIKFSITFVLLFLILTMLNTFAETSQTKSNNPDINNLSSNPKPGDIWKAPGIGMEFVFVPGGCFQMGSNLGDEDEKPIHKVCLNGFWIGKYEVTQNQWVRIMGENPSRFQYGENHPVERVCWNDVNEFISKLNQLTKLPFTLPSEAQWEYAARSGGKNQMYSGGEDIDDVAWYRSNSEFHTHKVGTKAANGFGIFDMSGNVSEWCKDIYSKDAYSNPLNNDPVNTPKTIAKGTYLVHRGGSWVQNPRYIRTTFRQKFTALYRYGDIGFRLYIPHDRLGENVNK